MASEKIGTVPPQQVRGSHPQSQLVFPEAFACSPQPPHLRASTVGDPKTSTRELTSSFLDLQPHYFHAPSLQPTGFRHQWNANCRDSGRNVLVDDDEEDDYDGDEEEEENNVENIVTVVKISDGNQEERFNSKCSSQKNNDISAVVEIKERNAGQSGNGSNNDIRRKGENAGGEIYYPTYLNQVDGQSSSSGQKDAVGMENGCTFSGRKDNLCLSESGESLREILSDPLNGKLMDDAMILPCGHSFGSAGIEQTIRMKSCYTCSQPISEDAITPNLSLRSAVQAFHREEELQVSRTPKRRKERYDMDKGTYVDAILVDHLRGRGVQFPFLVSDRVIIKGNKRTPPRFVGREAIVTAQCLNGWYVVKTLDNAESVKLQYRSLAKVAENPSHGKTIPNWL